VGCSDTACFRSCANRPRHPEVSEDGLQSLCKLRHTEMLECYKCAERINVSARETITTNRKYSHGDQPQYRSMRVDDCLIELRSDIARSVSCPRDFCGFQLAKKAFLCRLRLEQSITDLKGSPTRVLSGVLQCSMRSSIKVLKVCHRSERFVLYLAGARRTYSHAICLTSKFSSSRHRKRACNDHSQRVLQPEPRDKSAHVHDQSIAAFS
jgi:hypothetical protein